MTPESESLFASSWLTLGKLKWLGLGRFTYQGWEIAHGLQHYEGGGDVFKTPCSVWAPENSLLPRPGICEQFSARIVTAGSRAFWSYSGLKMLKVESQRWVGVGEVKQDCKVVKETDNPWKMRQRCLDGVLNRSRDLGSRLPPNPRRTKTGAGEGLWRTLAEWKEHKVWGREPMCES